MTNIVNGVNFKCRAAIGAFIIGAAIAAAGPATASVGGNCHQQAAPLYGLTHAASALEQSNLHDRIVACQQSHQQSFTLPSSGVQSNEAELPAEQELNHKMRYLP